ncbi:DUF4097 family beta strand repeat-containing protein [Faecalimonas sp.]|nr:DUF4097 family beta strand repeat-containing protein [Lachnospiraceae bacterium]
MKKGWKIFAIICAVLAGLGIVLCIAGFAVGATDEDVRSALRRGIGFIRDDDYYDEDDFEDRLEQTGREVKNTMDIPSTKGIDVEVDKMLVEVVATDEEKVRVENTAAEEIELMMSEDEDSVDIRTTKNAHKINDGGKLILYIPRNIQLPEINIQVNNGKINLSGIQTNELDLEIGRGEITATDFVAGELSVSCGQGKADIKGTAQRDVDLECGAGAINFVSNGTQTDFNYEIEVGAGAVQLGGQKFSGLAVEKTINNRAGKEMGIDCAAGTVNVTFAQ